MNEYDDILNRIVEEFYDTGRLALNEYGRFEHLDKKLAQFYGNIKSDYDFIIRQLTSDREFSDIDNIFNRFIRNWTVLVNNEQQLSEFLGVNNLNENFIEDVNFLSNNFEELKRIHNKFIEKKDVKWGDNPENLNILQNLLLSVKNLGGDDYVSQFVPVNITTILNDKIKELDIELKPHETSVTSERKRKEQIEQDNNSDLPLLSINTPIDTEEKESNLKTLQFILLNNFYIDEESKIELKKEIEGSIFGQVTKSYVELLQSEKAITEDGVVNNAVWNIVLGLLYNREQEKLKGKEISDELNEILKFWHKKSNNTKERLNKNSSMRLFNNLVDFEIYKLEHKRTDDDIVKELNDLVNRYVTVGGKVLAIEEINNSITELKKEIETYKKLGEKRYRRKIKDLNVQIKGLELEIKKYEKYKDIISQYRSGTTQKKEEALQNYINIRKQSDGSTIKGLFGKLKDVFDQSVKNKDYSLDVINNIITRVNDTLYTIYDKDLKDKTKKEKSKKALKSIISNIDLKGDVEDIIKGLERINNRVYRHVLYELSFCECKDNEGINYFRDCGSSLGNRSILLSEGNTPLKNLIDSDKKITECVKELYKKIIGGEGRKINKHDIIANKEINLGNIIITENEQIEVKNESKTDFIFSEFFAVYKNEPDRTNYYTEDKFDRYNQIISGIVKKLNENDGNIINEFDSTGGIFLKNYMFYPKGSYKLYWSDISDRSQLPNEKRLTVRFKITGEGHKWVEGNCNLQQNESTDRLDNIIENFFDTGRLKLKEELGSDEEDRISNTETKEYDDIYNDSENISQQEEKYKYAFEEYYKNLIDLKSVAESLEIPYDTVRKWVQLENKQFNYFIIKNYNLTNEQLITIKYFRRKVFYQWGKEKGISWNEQKKMYDYPEIPTIEEIESLVDKVNNNTIEKDKSWSNLYSNSVYFPRKKSAMNTFAVVNRINTMLKLQHGYNDVTIEEYWGLIKQLMEYSNQRTPKEKEELVEKIIEFIKLGDVTMDSLRKEFNVSQSTIQRLFIEYNLYDLYYENKSDVTYESSFETDCGIGKYFKRTGKQGNSSKISTGNYNIYLKEKIESENQTEILISEIYKTISKDGIVKYDLEILKPVKLTNGNNRILLTNKSKNKKFVEVKDIPYEKPYPLIEFYSIFKDPNLKSIKDDWLNKYGDNLNYILNGLSEMLNDDVDKQKGKGWEIIEKIKDNISGIFFNNYNFLPNDSYDLRWSTKGLRSEPRLSIEVNYKQGGNVYRWVEGNCNLQQNESTDRLDEIIETFFDTGKFVF